jgi:hypothetical protein
LSDNNNSSNRAKIANSVIDSVKQQPVCLSLLVVCLALVAYLYYTDMQANERAREVQALLAQCLSARPGT